LQASVALTGVAISWLVFCGAPGSCAATGLAVEARSPANKVAQRKTGDTAKRRFTLTSLPERTFRLSITEDAGITVYVAGASSFVWICSTFLHGSTQIVRPAGWFRKTTLTADILAQLLAPAGGRLDGRSGIYNLTSAGETSWFGFARALLTQSTATFGFTVPNLVPIGTSDYPRPATRPANSRLLCQRLAETFGINLPPWEVALSLVLETLAEGASRDKPR
jgi:hypothetical protein